jgi:hypothetical protein
MRRSASSTLFPPILKPSCSPNSARAVFVPTGILANSKVRQAAAAGAWCLLAHAPAGGRYRVSGIYERDRRLLEFLDQRGIRPGACVLVAQRNYDQTLALSTEVGKRSPKWFGGREDLGNGRAPPVPAAHNRTPRARRARVPPGLPQAIQAIC